MIGLAIRLVLEPVLMQASMNMSFFISIMGLEHTNINKKSGCRFTSKQDHYTKTNYEI